jgi:hypothetical protein
MIPAIERILESAEYTASKYKQPAFRKLQKRIHEEKVKKAKEASEGEIKLALDQIGLIFDVKG